jgi:carboxypeptidase family protein
LDDNGVENDTYPSSFTFPAILTAFNSQFTPTATEPQGLGPGKQVQGGYRLMGLGCAEVNVGGSAANANVTTTSLNVQAGTNLATIKPDLGDSITCTFTNQIVTAAPASISGKVVTSTGVGIMRAQITVVDAATGSTKTTYTDAYGMFNVSGLEVEKLYAVSVYSSSYTFTAPTQSFVLNGDLSGLVFTANPIVTRRTVTLAAPSLAPARSNALRTKLGNN